MNCEPQKKDQTMSNNSFFLLHWLVSGVAVLATSKLIPGFKVSGFLSACLAALGIGLANAILWPILFFLTLPINILTLGLFTFIVNGAVLKIAAAVLPGFEIKSWLSAIFGSIVLSIVSILLHYLLI
jgi:putative membrane protein